MHDIIIIGAGPAGLTAALYARRMGKTVLVLEKSTFGGQITYSPKVENYPGIAQMSGNAFADTLIEQVLAQGAEIEMETVTGITADGAVKTVVTEDGSYSCGSVIIATGVRHRLLGVEGETQFLGDGISFCAVCDGAFYKGKHVAVIGGGNSALQEAILLSDTCHKVTIVQNLPFLTGEKPLIDTLAARENVSYLMETTVQKVYGGENLEGLVLQNSATGEGYDFPVDGVFVAIGLVPENDSFRDIALLDERGYFQSAEDCLTGTQGVFVAGDCRGKEIRQLTTATSDGAVAALAACRYIDALRMQ